MEKRTIPVLGMMCAGCAANVERRMNGIEGVERAAVNLATRTVLVEYDETRVSPEKMKEEIERAGYDLVIEEDRSVADGWWCRGCSRFWSWRSPWGGCT